MSNGNISLNYTSGGANDPVNPFHYMPSMAAAVVSLVFYMLLFVVLTSWTIWKRSWYMITLLIGCIMEIIGYGIRIHLASNPFGQIPLYSSMHASIILAPILNAAVEYVLIGRLMHAVGDHYSLVKPKLVAWIFIVCDIISMLVQSTGAGILTSAGTNLKNLETGENILLGGLGVNLASFTLFCLQLFYFDYLTRKSPPVFLNGSIYQRRWRLFLYVIYVSSFFVLIRQIYRVIEFAQGFTGYLAVHEVYFYIFDTIPIFVSGTVYAVFFPGNGYLPRNTNETFAIMENNEQNLKQSNNNNNNVSASRKDLVLDGMS
ncbi:unnamed protein product [Rotaria socialis]|uniref:RTA1-domain-containing protein n=2 Tax=Rotaria socialis TaxID=392032 RepID=A0A817SFQ6_9BILA|nr:unnamed protein product [Rotaria socialis]CAF3709259.1 unnamed protein product [Rotaria socialis]CAF3782731.1 unnamed protein product [Rotaria socialis]CAF4489848.1 unnamed protein product [Rotaria socialis]CAF4657673.1 unnamed protein product [Rotaria socialis]